ncbi:MAG: hypothetical protein OEW58_12240 [Gammaproteobacteria bacterium]|nr:hypothetical protein [Gammaproteobacteria bacterium]
MKTMRIVIFSFVLLFGSSNSYADIFTSAKKHAVTEKGHLVIKDNANENIGISHGAQVLLGSKAIYVENDYPSVWIAGTFSVSDSLLIVIAVSDGGNSCPAMYKIIDVALDDNVTISEEFGTCSDLIKASVSGNKITFNVPEIHKGGGEKIWTYSDGGLNKPPVATKPIEQKKPYYNKEAIEAVSGKITWDVKELPTGKRKVTVSDKKGKVIFSEDKYKTGYVTYSYPETGGVRFFVLKLLNGEDGCHQKFRVFEFDVSGVKDISPELGICGAYTSTYFKDGGIVFVMKKTSKTPTQSWIYKNSSFIQLY